MKSKKKSGAKASPDWVLIYKKSIKVQSTTKTPKFKIGQQVSLQFVNQSGEPLIMGLVTIGRGHDDTGDPSNDDLTDTKSDFGRWLPDGEIDSGIAPVLDGDSVTVQFTVQKVDYKTGRHSWFHYCCFAIEPFPVNTSKIRRRAGRSWKVQGWSNDPHVIITS